MVAFAYIALGMLLPADRWPPAVLEARALPYAYEGARLAVGLLPHEYRPNVTAPPTGRETKAADLLHAKPQGKAIGGPGETR